MTHTDVQALLRELIGGEIDGVRPLAGGFFSRAFAFTADGREYVIRLNPEVHARESFAKDDYAWRHFASPELPIPRIVSTGVHGDDWYAISARIAGRTLGECCQAERRAVLPQLLDAVEAVGRADVRGTSGYGDWGSDGNAGFTSWRNFLAAIIEDHPDGYYQDWHRLFDNSFLERDVFETVYRQMLQLATRCPEERALIHNDLQFGNILTDGEQISGVIDWANALYGDPLYDIAWLTWQAAHPDWWYDDGDAILRARFGAAPDYDARIACYQRHIGLDHLRFYAKNGKQADYAFCRNWLLKLSADQLVS